MIAHGHVVPFAPSNRSLSRITEASFSLKNVNDTVATKGESRRLSLLFGSFSLGGRVILK